MAFYRCGGGGIPSSLKTDMNAVLNKKFGTSMDYPPADWAPTVNLMGPLPEKTIVSSPIADFSDGADDVPTKSLIVTIPPTLSGKSEVVCMGAHSGNFYNLANGRQLNLALPKGTTIYCKTESPSSYIKVYMRVKGASTSTVIFDIVASMGVRSYTLPDDIEYLTMTENNYNVLVNGGYKIMISLESDGDYTPYQTPTQYTASLGRTIYGGEVEIVNGVGSEQGYKVVVDGTNFYFAKAGNYYNSYPRTLPTLGTPWKLIQSDEISFGYNSNYGGFIFLTVARAEELGLYSAEEVNAYFAQNPTTIILNLATPTDFTFEGQEIPTRLGYNAFWSDQGDTEITYRADINLALGGQ